MNPLKVPVTFLLTLIAQVVSAADLGLSTAGATRAPLEVTRSSSQDPTVTPSVSQRKEMIVQFKGLVSMGLKSQTYQQWSGRSMADCNEPSSDEVWCHRCEIVMPEANGFYYFFPSNGSCTLQQLDVHVRTNDVVLLK